MTIATFDAAAVAEALVAGISDSESAAELVDLLEVKADKLIGELLDSTDLDNIPALRPLIADMLWADTLARINGPSGHFKSFVALDFAGHIGTGRDWHGHKTSQGLVVYIVAEGASGMRKRVRAWEQHYGTAMSGVKFLPRPVQAGDAAAWAVLVAACRKIRPALVIIDTQARATVGTEENSSKEMGIIVDRMEALKASASACVLLIHHMGLKGESGRGSTAVKGAMQTELTVVKKGKKHDLRVAVGTGKQKDDDEPDDLIFGIKKIELDGEFRDDGEPVTSVVLVPAHRVSGDGQDAETDPCDRRSPAGVKVLGALESAVEPLEMGQIIDRIAVAHGHGLRRETVSRELNGFLREGIVFKVEPASVALPNKWRLNRSSEPL